MSNAERDALDWALHLERVLDGAACATGRTLRKATMEKLKGRGYVTPILAVMVDDDGSQLDPERHRICYQLTEEGRSVARMIAARQVA